MTRCFSSIVEELVTQGVLIEGSAAHAGFHTIVGCSGAALNNQSCSSAALGAAASSVLTGLFSEASPTDTLTTREAKRNVMASLVTGIALTTGADSTAATHAAMAAIDNNWLATQQIVQRNKELAEAKTVLETMQVSAKWLGVDGGQDILTLTGVGQGLIEAGWEDIEGIAGFLSDPVGGLEAMQAFLGSSEALAQFGAQTVEDLKADIARIEQAFNTGGADAAKAAGKDIGHLLWRVGSAAAVVKGGVTIAKAGVNGGKKALDTGKSGKTYKISPTSEGMANVATYPLLKAQLKNENLLNIAAYDQRLAEALKGSGRKNPNFTIGSGTLKEAEQLGRIWVGEGATLVKQQRKCPGCWISEDRTRVYRPPSSKDSPHAITGIQANFVQQTSTGVMISNGHLNIK